MRKKVLLAGLSIAVALSMTACGGSKDETPKPGDTEQETVQQTEDDFSEDEMAGEDEEVYYSAEEICAMYYDYLTGELAEEELAELLETISQGVTVERAKEIFEESGELYGFTEPVVCEPASEILDASAGDQVLQVGDVVIQFPCTFGDFMEAIGGEFGDKDEASSSDRAMAYRRKEYSLDAKFQTLDTLGDEGSALVKSSDGSFLWLHLGVRDGEIQSAKDLYVTNVETGSSNVFFAGGIHAGLSMQEVDEITEKSANEFHDTGWESSSNNGSLYRFGNVNNKVGFDFYLDSEKNQLWKAEFGFEAPSSED